mmetsp:Transcript_174513/g.553956  ORF Transcript_174513/g.553956 Transcript_174513/m.553956 type:complete len:240 (+) Transcript_174513:719-1438(+)
MPGGTLRMAACLHGEERLLQGRLRICPAPEHDGREERQRECDNERHRQSRGTQNRSKRQAFARVRCRDLLECGLNMSHPALVVALLRSLGLLAVLLCKAHLDAVLLFEPCQALLHLLVLLGRQLILSICLRGKLSLGLVLGVRLVLGLVLCVLIWLFRGISLGIAVVLGARVLRVVPSQLMFPIRLRDRLSLGLVLGIGLVLGLVLCVLIRLLRGIILGIAVILGVRILRVGLSCQQEG